MESQEDKRMCGIIDYNHEVYDDCFGDILNILDLPVENLEGDGLADDWALKLGPIPSEVFREMLPPVSRIGVVNDNGGGGGGGAADLLTECCVINVETSQPKCQPILNSETFKFQPQPPSFSEGKKRYPMPRSFEAPSPDSVLERRTSGSTNKTVSFGTEVAIPVRGRTKRSRSGSTTTNPWSRSPLLIPLQKERKKRRNLYHQQPVNEMKKCSHCEITKTPQWREGPMGPKTLCNACGVRYRSGRLFPEYRPAASPTFIPSVHSNSHRKVIEMRQKMDENYDVMKKVLSSNSSDTRLCSCD